MNKKFWAAAFTLTGTVIGAGILGLPYVFAQSGFLVGVFWLLLLGGIITFVNLSLGEVTLRTKGIHQLTGYAEKYLGKKGKRIMFFAVLFGAYSALLAYLIGEGESLAKLIPGNFPPVILGIVFWIVLTLLLRGGLKGLKKIESWGVVIIIGIIMGIFVRFVPSVQISNLTTFNQKNFLTPIGVVFFSLLGFASIPELRKEIKGQEKKLKNAIILGTSISIILYILFSSIFVGKLGSTVSEVATLSFGPLITILGIFTILTSFLVISFSLHETFKYDIKTSEFKNFILTSFVPLILYILSVQFNMASFSLILGIGGTVSAGLTGALILLMAKKAKAKSEIKPEINMPINWPIIIILSIIFIAAIILEFVH